MLTAGVVERHARKRPFSSFMKRLANFKNSSSNTPYNSSKKTSNGTSTNKNKTWNANNNPYPESGHPRVLPTASSVNSRRFSTNTTPSQMDDSFVSYEDQITPSHVVMRSNRSTAPTLATNAETINSDAGRSRAETSRTAGGALSSRDGCANSTFSSPRHSQESLTTTLTTIQSTAPSAMLAAPPPAGPGNVQFQFSHQYPVSPPPSAIPSHLVPNHPHTYHAATANNILSDNASILTLASSSKRRRRRSFDTDASVRAIAPASMFGNSRESLPLSVLSANIEPTSNLYSSQNRPSVGGIAGNERASLYSTSGIPALNSERNSYIADKRAVDGASVRSGFLGHGRSESISGSITGNPSPLASPRDALPPRRSSRMSTDWRDFMEGGDEGVPADPREEMPTRASAKAPENERDEQRSS